MTAAASPGPWLDALLARAVLIDLETGADGAINKIGAVRDGREFRRQGAFNLDRALSDLDRFADDASVVIGHNLLGHDLPTLRLLAPTLNLLGRAVIDTLYLSPLAFPENPYHRLVKDYKLVRDTVADPVADCRLSAQLLAEQYAELARRGYSVGSASTPRAAMPTLGSVSRSPGWSGPAWYSAMTIGPASFRGARGWRASERQSSASQGSGSPPSNAGAGS